MTSAALGWVSERQSERGRDWARGVLTALLVLLVVPMHDVLSNFWHANQPWTDLIAVGLALLVLAPLLRRETPSSFARLRWPVVGVCLVWLVSAIANRVPQYQVIPGFRAMLPWMVLGLSSAAVFRPRDVPGLLRIASGTGVVLALYGVLSYLTFRGVGGPYEMPAPGRNLWETVMLYPYQCGAYPVPAGWRLISTFMNDNYFGVWLAALLPVTYAHVVSAPSRWSRRAWAAGLVVMLVALTWTYSRAAALALLVVVGVLAIGGERRALLFLLPVAATAPLFALGNDVYRFRHVVATQGGRIESVQRAAAMLHTSPWLGSGPGTRGLADMSYAKIGYETGALGLLAFGLLLVTVLSTACRRSEAADAYENRLRIGLVAGLAAVMAAAVGGEVWEMPQIGFYFWMMGGLLSVLTVSRQAPRQSMVG